MLNEAALVGISAAAAAAIRLMIETGCRRSEVLTVRRQMSAPYSGKFVYATGSPDFARFVRVPPSTMLMLEALPRKEDDPWLFAGRKPGTHMSGIDEAWRIVRELAGLHDVRIRDIRHSIASRSLAPGEGLPIVGRPAMVRTRRPRG